MKVTVVVPAYNEEGNILPTAEKVDACFRASSFRSELLLVDDGSTDETFAEMEEAANRYVGIRLLRHRRNRGLTEALKTGFANMTGDVAIFLPADLQYEPEEVIPKLVSKIDEGYDVAAGYKKGEDAGWRVLASKASNLTLQRLFGVPVRSMNSVRAFRREVLEDLPLRSERHSLMLPLAAAKGYTIGEVSVALYPRTRGESKFGISSFILAFFDMMAVRLLVSFSQRPILLFGLIATAFVAVASAIGIHVVSDVFQHGGSLLRPLFLTAGGLALAGLLLLLIGFLAELVVEQQELTRSQSSLLHQEIEQHRKLLDAIQKKLDGMMGR